jgi:prepilin-type N-terminal cleavage/methylation domain-containing protein
MLHRNNQRGFTILELMVVILLVGILTTNMYVFINSSTNQYLALHADSASFSDLAIQSQRVANVLRGLTDITAASDDGITMYAYFVPNDTYVSIIQYYKNSGGTKMLADVTPMTANPPIGSPITAKKRTYTVIDNLKTISGVSNFVYLDSAGGTLATPISDLRTIKGIRVNLAVPVEGPTKGGNSSISLSVALRNRKTNL